MTLRRLQEPPGSRCFVCAPGNPAGLRIPFWYDDAGGGVQATVSFDERHCGAPSYVHAGLTMAVLAEAMAWTVVTTTGQFAITLAAETGFRRPLRSGLDYLVAARVDRAAGPTVHTSALVRAGELTYATATAEFRVLSAAVAARLRARVGGAG